MALLSKEAILAADDRDYEVVACPEWGGEVRVRSITGAERDRWESSLMKGRGRDRQMNLDNARARLVALCAVDEAGKPLFRPEDIGALGRRNARAIDRVFEAGKRLAGLTDEDVDKLTEDFEPTQGEDSTTD
jgi:hypothetical protein